MKKFYCLAVLALSVFICHAAPGEGRPHDFAKWEREVSAFERSDATNPPPKGCIVFIGSSTIGRWKTLARDFPGQPVVNRAFGGSEIEDSTHFADRVIFPYESSMVFIRAGGNDLWAGKSPERVAADFKDFAEKVHARLPKAVIVYISQSPSIARWIQRERDKQMNDLIAAYVQGKPHLRYVETYDLVLGADGQPRPELFVADKLHINEEGYKLMTERVRPFLPH